MGRRNYPKHIKCGDRSTLATDGLQEVPASEFQSFPARIIGKSMITIPSEIFAALQLRRGLVLEVAIRKMSHEYLMQTYGAIAARICAFERRGKKPEKPRVICPVCNKLGAVYKDKCISIRHAICDGYPKKVVHSITRKYPEEAKKFKTMLSAGLV